MPATTPATSEGSTIDRVLRAASPAARSPQWNAQLRDALTRRQKELPIVLVDDALAAITPGATEVQSTGEGVLLETVVSAHLAAAGIRAVFFVDGIADDPRMLHALRADRERMLLVAHRAPDVARHLAARLASWKVASTVHGVTANAAEALAPPMNIPRPALVVLPGNVLGVRTTVEMVRALRVVRSLLRSGDRALITVDLRQDAAALEATFAEPGGSWAHAHRLLVDHVARALDGSLNPESLAFEARFDRANARMEGHLVARRAMLITLPDGTLIPIGRRESFRTVISARLDRKRLEGTLRGCALGITAWIEDASASAAVALIEPVMHT